MTKLVDHKELKPDFSFLESLDDYSQYYADLESLSKNKKHTKFSTPRIIPGLGQLMPLRRKHALNSYWKSFRLTIEQKKIEGKNVNELFLFLPLVMNIPCEFIKVNNKKFKTDLYVYLFPFGCCCVNLNVTITNESLTEFIKLIPSLKKKSTIMPEYGPFEPSSKAICEQIDETLFEHSYGNVFPFSTHNFIFIKDTSPKLDDKHHRNIIAAIMSESSLEEISTLTKDKIDAIMGSNLKNKHNGEILYFNTKSTFLYASPEWIDSLSPKYKAMRKSECMNYNYQSFFNLLFALKQSLKYAKFNKDELSKHYCKITQDYVNNPIYFKHAFDLIVNRIGGLNFSNES